MSSACVLADITPATVCSQWYIHGLVLQSSKATLTRTNAYCHSMQARTREQRQRQIGAISEAPRAPALYNAARQPSSLFFSPHPSDLPDWSLGSRYTSQGLERQEVHSCASCRLGADALRG
ncbi:hypothetical protein K523DRAFT_402693 [Schizophyllum commune Tattone D]|nr:hypothetical protein K523DRAFT_402693 [Schizophyllum commune Tattone D]